MGITGLIPFLEKASRRANVGEFSGCTVVIDSYCWLHKGAFACADKLVRGEETDIHIKYCLKYVTMLLAKNIKPILVFDGRHLPAKAMTEAKRRESRDISKKRAAELLSLGKIEEARSYMRRSVDITHAMALSLIKECRKRNVDCIVAPYEADAQLAYLNIKNIAQLVITEDSDLILFGCTKVLFKMDLDGTGTLVETAKLPLIMRCPIEHYRFDKFRQMCIMSGCDYLASLPGIGLAKARQFVTATQDSNFANALKKLPSFFNRSSLTVTDEYRENFLKAEATFKHQYVYDPIERQMVRLTEPDDEDIEKALCVNAGELLDPKTAFQLALGNLDPFSLKRMDDWHPDYRPVENGIKTDNWKDKGTAPHPSIWSPDFVKYLQDETPWLKKVKRVEPIIAMPTVRSRKVVNLVTKVVPETQDESLSIETLSNMYCVEPALKKPKLDPDATLDLSDNYLDSLNSQDPNKAFKSEEIERNIPENKSPILENKQRSFKKSLSNTYSVLKRLSKFPRTTLDGNVVESKFFNGPSVTIEESPERTSKNPFKVDNKPEIDQEATVSKNSFKIENNPEIDQESPERISKNPFKIENKVEIDSQCSQIEDSQLENSQKENSPCNSPTKLPSPILEPSPRCKTFRMRLENELSREVLSEDSVIENTYPMEDLVTPVDSQESFGNSPPKTTYSGTIRPLPLSQPVRPNFKKSTCRVPGLKRTASVPCNQPTLLSKFGFQKKPILKR
ncbi:exonuclease 1 [Leguminivora glycinivorella]|uniref:exonuclease 1 n=1 Tax=Leguminivora glycinivorella TaxID=1035111 RepID=UPI00200F773A|nr:exonuclease 1 [Leguminivora glycinivorella]